MKKLFFLLALLITFRAYPQFAPDIYWQFESASTPLQPTIGPVGNTIVFSGAYTIDNGGPVGKYLTESVTGQLAQAGNVNATTAISFQFIFKPGRDFSKTREAMVLAVGSTSIAFSYPYVVVNYSLGSGQQIYYAMDKVGIVTWKTIMDGGWHHVAVVLNASAGTVNLWIDGQNPSVFSTTIGSGTLFGGNSPIYYATTVDYTQFAGSVDEVAIYINKALTGNQIYRNYLDYLSGNHYTTALSASVPPPQPISAPVDSTNYMVALTTTGVNVSPIDQLKKFPGPRFAPISIASDSLLPIFNCADPYFMGGALQSWQPTLAQAVRDGMDLQERLALYGNWVYNGGATGQGLYATDTTTIQGLAIKRAKANPKLKLEFVTLRPQINPFDRIPFGSNPIWIKLYGAYKPYYYLQNSAGKYIDPNGNVLDSTYSTTYNLWYQSLIARPSISLAQSYSNFPDTTEVANEDTIKAAFNRISAALGVASNVYHVWENTEDFAYYLNAMTTDPVVSANLSASGYNARTFQSMWRARLELQYRNGFIGSGTTTGTDSTLYQIYQNQGNPNFFHQWAQMRETQFSHRGKKLSSTDYYVRVPQQWYYNCLNSCADHGEQWMIQNQQEEFAAGDSLQSPFVAAGWDRDETKNIQPGQWLGMLKYRALKGAETYFSSIFSLSAATDVNPDPRNYIWQMWAPSLAQGITTRFQRYLHYGYLMPGDLPATPTSQNGYKAYQFNTGDFRAIVAVRKDASENKYVLGGNLNQNSNMIGNTEDSVVRTIILNGENLTFALWKWKGIYIYDNSDPSNKIFYQLDYWHEKSHPWRWSQDFNFQAEVNDNYNQVQLKTTRASGASAGNYVNSTTYVSYSDTTTVLDTIRFNFQPRSALTYYFWIRLKSRTGTTTGVQVRLNATTSKIINCVSDTGWYWYRLDTCINDGSHIISFATSPGDYHLGILPINKYIQIDQIVLTTDPNANYPEVTNPCAPVTANITPSGATTFCNGGSVTLTATLGSAYLWSTGASTQAINVVTSGNYTVQVTDGMGCTGISAAEIVTVKAVPNKPVITVTGSLSICSGGSVTLTSSAIGTGIYLWSTGATTQAITTGAAASYRVTVTNSQGCTASSNAKTVVVNALPAIPTITPGSPISFCDGGSCTLTSSAIAGGTYLWTNGTTSQAATVYTAGTYTVTVTSSAGCTRSSAGTIINVNANPALGSIAPQTNVCPAVTFDLSTIVLVNTGAPGVSSYHATQADAIAGINPIAAVVGVSSPYYIRVTSDSSCYDYKSVYVTIQSCVCVTPPTVDVGGDQTICAGSNVSVTASIGGTATAVTWSTTNGTGTFTAPSSLTTNYIPSAADTVIGSILLKATTDNPSGPPCQVANDMLILTIAPRPTVSIAPSGTVNICSGSSTVLSASNNTGFLWSTGATTQTITTASAGNYICTVTNIYGCSNISATKTVVVNANPSTPVISGVTSFCSGGSTTLTSTASPVYLWSTGATTQAISVNTASDYYVTVTNVASCTASSSVSVFSVPTPATPVITPSGPVSFCNNSSVILYSSIADSYLWSTGSTAQNITVTTSGTFTVTVTINGCTASSASITTTVSNNFTPTITPSYYAICAGQSVVLAASAATTYLWSTGETTQSINVNTPGAYYVFETNGSGCSGTSATTNIVSGSTLVPSITVSGGATTFCSGGSRTLTCNAATSYLWSTGSTSSSISVSPVATTTYTVTVTDAYGCTKSAIKKLTVNPSPSTPVITATGSTTFCINGRVTLTSSASSSYLWSNGSTSKQVIITTGGNFRVTVTNSSGCTASSAVTTTVVNGGCTATCGIVSGVAVKNITTTTATIYWGQSNLNSSYKVYLVNMDGGNIRSGTYGADIRETIYKNLRPGYNYKSYIIGKCAGVTQDTSSVIYFQTLR